MLVRALCVDDISSLDVMVRSVLLVGSGTPNCDGQHQVGQNLINPSNKKLKTGQSPVLFPFEKLVDTPDLHGCM